MSVCKSHEQSGVGGRALSHLQIIAMEELLIVESNRILGVAPLA